MLKSLLSWVFSERLVLIFTDGDTASSHELVLYRNCCNIESLRILINSAEVHIQHGLPQDHVTLGGGGGGGGGGGEEEEGGHFCAARITCTWMYLG